MPDFVLLFDLFVLLSPFGMQREVQQLEKKMLLKQMAYPNLCPSGPSRRELQTKINRHSENHGGGGEAVLTLGVRLDPSAQGCVFILGYSI